MEYFIATHEFSSLINEGLNSNERIRFGGLLLLDSSDLKVSIEHRNLEFTQIGSDNKNLHCKIRSYSEPNYELSFNMLKRKPSRYIRDGHILIPLEENRTLYMNNLIMIHIPGPSQ